MPLCWYGNHLALTAQTGNGVTYCAAHPPPQDEPAADPPRFGMCSWHGGHGPCATFLVPRDGRRYCRDHLFRILVIATWPDPLERVKE